MMATEKVAARDNIWEYLIKNNMRQTTLADIAGVSYSGLNRFLGGKNEAMGEYTLRKIAMVMGMKYEELIGGDAHDQHKRARN